MMISTKDIAPEPLCSVLFVALSGCQLLDVVGPMEAFTLANRILAGVGSRPFYRLELASLEAELTGASGLRVRASLLSEAAPPDTLVVGGGLDAEDVPIAALTELSRLVGGSRRAMSVCAGAFTLGQLGLLDGRRCTTHWLVLDDLARRFPGAQVEKDALVVKDGPITTSAGLTAGLDLALSVIDEDLGSETARTVARALVTVRHRSGGQAQFGPALPLRSELDPRLRALIAHIIDHPAEDHRVEKLAERLSMSPRQCARVFLKQTGQGPGAAVRALRLDAARAALETSDQGLARIAKVCGLGSEATLRRAFEQVFGVSPGDYRRSFRSAR